MEGGGWSCIAKSHYGYKVKFEGRPVATKE
jgi:hypothetical protein